MQRFSDSAAVAAVNHLLAQSPWATQRLMPFSERKIRVLASSWRIDLAVGDAGLLESAPADAAADVEIELPLAAPLKSLFGGRDEVVRAAKISGNADFADAVGFVLRNLRWDAEEDLSRLFGDIAARRLVTTFSGLIAWQKQALLNLGQNVGEFATFESMLLPSSREVGDFAADVAALTRDIAAAEAHVERFKRR